MSVQLNMYFDIMKQRSCGFYDYCHKKYKCEGERVPFCDLEKTIIYEGVPKDLLKHSLIHKLLIHNNGNNKSSPIISVKKPFKCPYLQHNKIPCKLSLCPYYSSLINTHCINSINLGKGGTKEFAVLKGLEPNKFKQKLREVNLIMTLQQKIATAKHLSPNEALKSDEIFVVNNSTNPKGIVSIAVVTKTGTKLLMVHNTWIPIELTAEVSANDLRESSSDFRSLISKGMIFAIEPKIAKEVLQAAEGAEEAARLVTSVNTGNSEPDLLEAASEEADIDARVMHIITQETSAKEKLSSLKNIASDLKETDFKYLAAKAEEDNVREWAQTAL